MLTERRLTSHPSEGEHMTTRLISVDSHVRGDARTAQGADSDEIPRRLGRRSRSRRGAATRGEMGGVDRSVMVAGFSHEAFADPGYYDPAQRLKAMDRDGVQA